MCIRHVRPCRPCLFIFFPHVLRLHLRFVLEGYFPTEAGHGNFPILFLFYGIGLFDSLFRPVQFILLMFLKDAPDRPFQPLFLALPAFRGIPVKRIADDRLRETAFRHGDDRLGIRIPLHLPSVLPQLRLGKRPVEFYWIVLFGQIRLMVL